MIHPFTELRFIGEPVGYGVFATEWIPEGTILYVKDALEIEVSPETLPTHTPEMQAVIEKYSYIDERGYRIISWDFAKYVNHCCRCNSMSTGYGFEIALRDIAPGEEITDEYGLFNLTQEMQLLCPNSDCRCVIRPGDFEQYGHAWDERVRASLPRVFEVAQALLPFVAPEAREALDAYRTDPAQYRSVFALRYRR